MGSFAGVGVKTANWGIAAEFFFGVSPIIMPVFIIGVFIGGPAGGIPAGVLPVRLGGSRIPAGAIKAASGSSLLGAGAAGAGVEGAIVGGGGGALAFASSAGSSAHQSRQWIIAAWYRSCRGRCRWSNSHRWRRNCFRLGNLTGVLLSSIVCPSSVMWAHFLFPHTARRSYRCVSDWFLLPKEPWPTSSLFPEPVLQSTRTSTMKLTDAFAPE